MERIFPPAPDLALAIDQIETDWSIVHEPAHVVLRYARAVQRYIHAIIVNSHDAEEVSQEFLLWVTQHGLPRTNKDRGRFRDYLKTVVRNAALNFLRRSHAVKQRTVDMSQFAAVQNSQSPWDHEWIEQWRECLLERAWARLKHAEALSAGKCGFTVLQLRVAHPEADSEALAQKVSALSQRPIRPDAFRKQLSRARRQFAQYLVDEVAQTLDCPEPPDVESELADLGLMQYVRHFLPLKRRVSIT